MLEINALAFLSISAKLEQMMTGATSCMTENEELPGDLRLKWVEDLGHIVRHCEILQLRITGAITNRMTGTYKEQGNCKRFYSDVRSLTEVFMRELETSLFFQMPGDKAAYYGKPILFGQEVADKFTSATFDVEEAGNCFATGRNTACVMHLMRALEVAIGAIGRGIGLPDVVAQARNSWGTALKNIGDQIGANDKAANPTWTPKSSFFKDARAHLFAVKVAWRDTAMHLEKKYDEKDAKRIYDAAKNFMEHLAEHLDESGQFIP